MKRGHPVRRALLIDDDPLLGKLVSHQLAVSGIECIHLTSFEEAMHFLDRRRGSAAGGQRTSTARDAWPELDVVILDYHLNNGQTGLPLCRLIRSGSDLPVVMLTGELSAQTAARCLEEGVDQYICKPFLADELVARIQASIRARHSRRASLPRAVHPAMKVNLGEREFEFGSVAVALTEKESLLADILVRHAGLPVAKDDLFQYVYGRLLTFQSRCLDVLVGRLRKKLAVTGNRCRVLSVRNCGYKLVVKPDA